jgi:hypothetical protein
VTPRVEVDGRDVGFERRAVEAGDARVRGPADAGSPTASGTTPVSSQASDSTTGGVAADEPRSSVRAGAANVRVPLLRLAHGRSGDKGDTSNVGIVARSPAAYEALQRVLTADAVRDYFAHVVRGEVRRYLLPGLHALNFTMERALGGGGVASLRYDPQGKAFAQMLLDLEVEVPADVLESLR